ncbi:aminodeoxychorismate synthase component I [Curvibacter delicatus]|uniref:aminodeoxychorismate synthase component I n=1 Tax=Curvibacter delicatus TaxID=80879 RepID=UPI000A0314C7|nr:aminodeoxychorismate synthase component I [Curvibacter delicatus]
MMQALIHFRPTHSAEGNGLRGALERPVEELVAHAAEEVLSLLRKVESYAKRGYWCVGYLRYEAASAFDPAFVVHPAEGPLARFGVYEQFLPWPELLAEPSAMAQWQATLSRETFDAQMAQIHASIAAGGLYQVNYTAPLVGSLQGQPLDLFRSLLRAQPHGYAAYIDSGEEQVLSVSPELFFDWQAPNILTRPMKGTAPRGHDPAEDIALAEQLSASPKERAENVMIVDLLRNDLSRIAELFSVQVPELFHVETLPTVLQMSSDVVAKTRPDVGLADVFQALFPCGSITGAPKVQAMRLIQELEPQPRGVYCGAIGVVRPGGHATFNVAIRTVTLRDGRLRCGIGSGITSGAKAADEWAEWRHKRAFLERASQPFELLETLRLEEGVLRDASRHLARMERAARHFSYPFARARIETSLAEVVQAHPQGTWRVRLLLAATGQCRAEAYALAERPARARLVLAERPLEEAHGEFVRFKTTRRAHYEVFAPQAPDIFDTLLWNEDGQLTECTRSNVAVQFGDRWVTPALSCGLLGGVMRERLLEEGWLKEGVIAREELPQARGVAVFNSLRGWMEVELIMQNADGPDRGIVWGPPGACRSNSRD